MDIVIDASAILAVIVAGPERTESSPLDVPSIKAGVTTDELVSVVRRERGRATASTRFLKGRG